MNERRCNRASDRGYAAWRACWHGLLDPYSAALTAVGAEMELLATGTYPQTCVGELQKAKVTFGELSDRVRRLLAGIDSAERKAQVGAMKTYDSVVNGAEKGYAAPFHAVTRVCYSPDDLATMRPSASATPGTG